MYAQAHAGLGWALGVLTPGSDRRLRAWCFVAAVLPDIDAIPFIFGKELYDRWHHTFGHNIWLGLLAVAAAWFHGRDLTLKRRAVLAGMVGFCFASHLLTDMKLSGWEVYLFWPLNRDPYMILPVIQLGHPINYVLAYGLMAAALVLPLFRAVTPLEILSPRLDRMVLNCFRRRTLECGICQRRCNNRCEGCDQPVCGRHSRLGWYFRLRCPGCAAGLREKGSP